MKQFIIDASVGIKWFFEEELSDKALQLKEASMKSEIQLIVPEFFFIEMANICCMKYKSKLASWQHVDEGIGLALRLPFVRYSDAEIVDVAAENVMHYKISEYDAMYVSLAEIYLAPLVTADEALIKNCQRKHFDFIEHLRDVELN